MGCDLFPVCARCGRAACDHGDNGLHAIRNVCIGYQGYPDCSTCGLTSWQHDEASPHGISGLCDGYQFPPGLDEPHFEGQGGGYGGGGASGGW